MFRFFPLKGFGKVITPAPMSCEAVADQLNYDHWKLNAPQGFGFSSWPPSLTISGLKPINSSLESILGRHSPLSPTRTFTGVGCVLKVYEYFRRTSFPDSLNRWSERGRESRKVAWTSRSERSDQDPFSGLVFSKTRGDSVVGAFSFFNSLSTRFVGGEIWRRCRVG